MRAQVGEHTLWVGGAGTGTALGVLRSAREAFGAGVTLVAADVNPRHLVAAASLADHFEQVPPVADAGFEPALLAGLLRHGADTYLPILDSEIELAARLRAAGRLPAGLTLLAPPVEAAALCLDKLAAARWLEARGLPTPATAPLPEAAWGGQGLIVKPRRGWGSHGVHAAEDEAALAALAARPDAGDLVAQVRCAPPEITIDAFRSRDGALVAVACRDRLEVKAGVSTKARVHHDERLLALAAAVAEGLGLVGAFCMQVMHGPGGEPLITDINPRPGAGTRLSVAAGFDPMAAMLADAWGADPVPTLGRVDGECFVVRAYEEIVL